MKEFRAPRLARPVALAHKLEAPVRSMANASW